MFIAELFIICLLYIIIINNLYNLKKRKQRKQKKYYINTEIIKENIKALTKTG